MEIDVENGVLVEALIAKFALNQPCTLPPHAVIPANFCNMAGLDVSLVE